MDALFRRIEKLLRGRVNSAEYLSAGFVCFAVKYALDALVAWFGFGVAWTPERYLEPSRFYGIWNLPPDQWAFYTVLLWLAVPFIVLGVVLTVARLRDAGWPLWLTLLFFVPLVNLAFFIILGFRRSSPSPAPMSLPAEPELRPSTDQELAPVLEELLREGSSATQVASPGRGISQQADHHQEGEKPGEAGEPAHLCVPHSDHFVIWLSGALGLALVAIGSQVFRSYGWGVFVGIPFLIGLLAGMMTGTAYSGMVRSLRNATLALLVVGAGLLVFALDGIICIAMAFPLAWLIAMLGVLVGHAIKPVGRRHAPGSACCLAVVAAAGVEGQLQEAPVREVVSHISVDVPPAAVWPAVIAFPSLSPPKEWLFRAGIAYPTHATIDGEGVGAVRLCVFSTGSFVEPITRWDPPHRLAFDVTQQPEPMKERSLYRNLHPPHMDGFLQSHRGEFRLIALPRGRTRLEGSTWYSNRMWPQPYWNIWSDYIIHRIHLRVLQHIKHTVEKKATNQANTLAVRT